jgi:hypothetical protein
VGLEKDDIYSKFGVLNGDHFGFLFELGDGIFYRVDTKDDQDCQNDDTQDED